jgi:hypothetical protein
MIFPETLKIFFEKYDLPPHDPLLERTVYSNLFHYIEEHQLESVSEFQAEKMAFEFLENYTGKPSVWNTYYQPQIYYHDADKVFQSPDITLITPDFIKYWHDRSREAKHPILKSRYSGLVYEFSLRVTGVPVSFETAMVCAYSLIDSVAQNLNGSMIADRHRMRRALTLALNYNNQGIVGRIKTLLLNSDQLIPVDEQKNVWANSFDLLVNRKPALVNLEEEKSIIDLLENRLENLKHADPWASKAAAERLAGYYYKKNLKGDVGRVLEKLGQSFDLHINKVPAIQQAGHLQELMLIYRFFQLNEEAEKLMIRIRSVSINADEEFKKITVSHDFEASELVTYANQVLKYDGDIMFARIIKAQMLTKAEVSDSLQEAFQKHPVRFIIPTRIVDKKGRVLAILEPYPENKEGHKVQYLYKSLEMAGVYLHFIFLEGIKQSKLNTNTVMDFLKKSCIIEKERHEIIQAGVKSFFDKNYLVCIHLLIPQFEESVRNLLEINGGNMLTYNDHTYPVKTFHAVLDDPIVQKAFGEDHVYYFKALFTDARGWNLRNQVAHGLLEPELFNEQTAQRLLHAFFCLGMIRWQEVPA